MTITITPEIRAAFFAELRRPQNQKKYAQKVLLVVAEDVTRQEFKTEVVCMCAEGALLRVLQNNYEDTSDIDRILQYDITFDSQDVDPREVHDLDYEDFNDLEKGREYHYGTGMSSKEVYDKAKEFIDLAHTNLDTIRIHDYKEATPTQRDMDYSALSYTANHYISNLPRVYLTNLSTETRANVIASININPYTHEETLPDASFFDEIFGPLGVEMYILNDAGVRLDLMADILEETNWGMK